MKKKNIEVEGGEFLIQSKEGHYAVIPAKHRQEVMDMVKDGCDDCINAYIQTLPKDSEYAEDGTVVSELYTQKTGKDWNTAQQEGLTTGSYDDNMKLRQRLLSGEFDNKVPQYDVSKTSPREGVRKNADGSVSTHKMAYTEADGKYYAYPTLFQDKGKWIEKDDKNDWEAFKEAKNRKEIYEFNTEKEASDFAKGSWKKDNLKQENYSKAENFNEAFKIARNQLGANQIFEYKGRKYGTNLKGESFEPSEEVLAKHNMNKPEVKERLQQQNKMANSVYSDKQTAKLEPEYQDWDKVKKRKQEVNKMNQADIIREYHRDSNEQYLVLDKKRGKMHLYQGDKEVSSYNVGTGANVGDEQTKTVVRNGKVMWNEGNKMTGAGIYTVSGVNPNNPHYSNAPTWNFKNEQGIEVPMAIHSSFGDRTTKINDKDEANNRLSNGCINGVCYNLKELHKKGYKQGQKLYVLPDDENNRYEVSNGKLIFKSKDQNVNRTVNTLNYKPIKIEIDEKKFKEKVFTALDFNDETEYNNTTKPFVQALADNKQKIMKTAKINGDTYNDIAKIAFGIYGTESNFGDTHSAVGNLARAVNKALDPKSSSSPDYKAKATTYRGNKDRNSVGLTQIRFNMLDESEKEILKELGITKNTQLLNPEDSAIATVAILVARYNNQLTDEEKQDLETYLPKKWNLRSNYADRVKSNSQYITIKELN